MQQHKVPPEFVAVLKTVAAEKGLGLAHDTHYDGFDWELRWWSGQSLHRLNFQPWLDEKLLVSRTGETYPSPARLVRWGSTFVPFFPQVAEIDGTPLGEFGPEATSEQFEMRVRELLSNAP